MKEFMYGDETVKVLEASGYNDGYYWDMNAKIESLPLNSSLANANADKTVITNDSSVEMRPTYNVLINNVPKFAVVNAST